MSDEHNYHDGTLPQALGDLRAALPADVSDLVSGELHKDLTHATIHDITEHLGDVLAV